MPVLPFETWMHILGHCDSLHDLRNLSRCSFLFREMATICIHKLITTGKFPPLYVYLSSQCNRKPTVMPFSASRIENDQVVFTSAGPQPQNGFRGLAYLLMRLCRLIKSDSDAQETEKPLLDLPALPTPVTPPARFRKEAYVEISQFLQNGWTSMSGKIAPALLPAYTMLFSHILRTYDGICTRPSASMQSDLQMALLTQTWRVVDVLAPASSRDVRICTEIGCCAGELEMHCSTSPDDLDHESPSNVMFDSESSMNSEEVLCDSESATIKLRTFDFPMGKRARANMICLIQGGEVENVGIAHVEVTMGINEFIAEFAAMERLEMENEDTETESTRENDESVRESFAELLTYL